MTPHATASPIGPDSRLSLHRFVVTPNDNDYTVRRYGSGDGLRTGAAGVQALALLRDGLSVGEARGRLASHMGCAPERVNLDPLLRSLGRAGLIRAVDGVRIGRPAPGVADWWRYEAYPRLWRWVSAKAYTLPFHWVDRTVGMLNGLYPNPKRKLILATVEANMAGAFPHWHARRLRRVARESYAFKTWVARRRQAARILGEQRIFGPSDAEARRTMGWFVDRVEVSGLEHLERARSEGRGVILCGYHFGFILSIPFVLAARGYAVTAMGLVRREYDEAFYAALTRRMTQLGYAPFRMLPHIDLHAMSTLVRLLGQGETALMFADAYLRVSPTDGAAGDMRHDLKRYRPSQLPVPLLGTTVKANRGLGWLHEATRAPVVPVAHLRSRAGRETLLIRPPLPSPALASRDARIEATVRAVYAELEGLVRDHPTQWWYWKSLHKMSVDERDPGRTEPTGSPAVPSQAVP